MNFVTKKQVDTPDLIDIPRGKYKFKDLVRTHVRSYKYAFRGLLSIFLQQLNFQIEALITLVVIFAGFFFGITKSEWIIIVFTVSLVLVSEAINTAIEAICDAVHREYSKEIKYAKDVGAGAVLLAAMASVAIGFAIFWPYIKEIF